MIVVAPKLTGDGLVLGSVGILNQATLQPVLWNNEYSLLPHSSSKDEDQSLLDGCGSSQADRGWPGSGISWNSQSGHPPTCSVEQLVETTSQLVL